VRRRGRLPYAAPRKTAPRMTAAAATQKLRLERDRYVAFAFAAAELLLEVDNEGAIRFAAGAARALSGRDPETLLGRPFEELLAAEDRPLFAALSASVAHGGRFVPIGVRLAHPGTPPAVLGGTRLPSEPDTLFLTLTTTTTSLADPADAPVFLSKDDFTARALARALADPHADLKLTLVAVGGLDECRQHVAEQVAAGLTAAVGRYLAASAPRTESTSELAPGRYGVLHSGVFEEARFRDGVQGAAKALDAPPGTVRVHADTVDLSIAGLSGRDAGRALAYCIERFANSDIDELSAAALRGDLTRPIADASARVADLRASLAERNLQLLFQPVVELNETRRIHHAEALVRFADGQSTASAVAFAEAVRLIADLDLAVCALVIKELDALPDSVPVAVNLSGRSLESPAFATALMDLLDANKGVASRMLFELTESAAVLELETVNNVVQSLRGRGHRVCLDDFGAGASSLHYLRAFAVDFVKFDGGLIHSAMGIDERDRALLRHITSYCEEIGTATVAEMVEEERQASKLRTLGIGYAQGYLFGRPGKLMRAVETPVRRAAKRKGYVETWA
jgi:EAL domain-containing protein (putative c-di-GMP-specific phosphodiesterase class I)